VLILVCYKHFAHRAVQLKFAEQMAQVANVKFALIRAETGDSHVRSVPVVRQRVWCGYCQDRYLVFHLTCVFFSWSEKFVENFFGIFE
jgi:hypothetical protein